MTYGPRMRGASGQQADPQTQVTGRESLYSRTPAHCTMLITTHDYFELELLIHVCNVYPFKGTVAQDFTLLFSLAKLTWI